VHGTAWQGFALIHVISISNAIYGLHFPLDRAGKNASRWHLTKYWKTEKVRTQSKIA
jgi:hypothetical protein